MDTVVYDAVLGPVSLFLFVFYNLYVVFKAGKDPRNSAYGSYVLHRKNWVRANMQGHKDILAIQTLRNMIMASNLMATTCMVIIGLLINNLTNQNSNFEIFKTVGFLSYDANRKVYAIKTLVACTLFIASFLNHSLAIRYLVHLGFLMGDTIDRNAEKFSILHLQRGGKHFTLGQRFFYISLTTILWLFDVVYMVAGVVILLFILWKIDTNHGLDEFDEGAIA
eukprot:Phypoly_transcript_17065.p1 GENE.Phypoly_transcript_17065~~Phypoly_transcript_17065.p1  ORF type:complete len:223 (+),score=20.55 Phypoly_transcript_17065:95-763(+)